MDQIEDWRRRTWEIRWLKQETRRKTSFWMKGTRLKKYQMEEDGLSMDQMEDDRLLRDQMKVDKRFR